MATSALSIGVGASVGLEVALGAMGTAVGTLLAGLQFVARLFARRQALRPRRHIGLHWSYIP